MGIWRRLNRAFSGAAAELFPGYFSLVMATGALSIANQLLGYRLIALLLLAVNVVAYAALVALILIRLWRFFPRVVRDITNHALGPGFFTLVAGTCVFGTQLIVVAGAPALAHWLWLLGLGLWFVIMYAFFFAVTVREHKPTLAAGINGAWLIAAVATQAVSVLGTLAAPTFGASHEIARFVALAMYLLGAMLYLAIITLIFYRFTFVKVTVESMTPPYWINMGAVAISTLAGATLMLNAGAWGFIGELLPFIKGFTLFFWVTATWWIPLLVALMTWRHLWRRHPIRYEPQFWGMVFPLAMYTTATFQLARAEGLDFLAVIPEGFVFLALAAWLLAFIGLLRSIARGLRAAPAGALAPR
ncbi:MAG TPA: tellurite resistance/C4-dicarboxylate transporter family protein [Alphaproteobacteria bacterium]|nr:tellurite resistance/C4-dicarboxylate transporter family protein [Alphaproteobacteria bacterium]